MHWNIWLEVIVISLIIAFFTYIFVNNLTFHRIKKIKFLLILINSLALVSFYNATHVAPFKWYALREHPTRFGCVAVLFNKNNSIKFAKYLEQVVNDFITGKSNFFLNKDLLIEIFRRNNNLVEFIAEPSVFQHQGLHSSLENKNELRMHFKEKMLRSYSFLDDYKLIKNFENYRSSK